MHARTYGVRAVLMLECREEAHVKGMHFPRRHRYDAVASKSRTLRLWRPAIRSVVINSKRAVSKRGADAHRDEPAARADDTTRNS